MISLLFIAFAIFAVLWLLAALTIAWAAASCAEDDAHVDHDSGAKPLRGVFTGERGGES